ncbi:hypothetical protein [Persicobacter diffluens]
MEVLSGQNAATFHSGVKPYRRDQLVPFLQGLAQEQWSRIDDFNYAYLMNDSWELVEGDSLFGNSQKAIWNTFYKKQSDFLMVNEPDFNVHVNPVIYFAGGMEQPGGLSEEENGSRTLFQNTRGAEIRGQIGGRLGFYTFIGTTQAIFPVFVHHRTDEYRALPGEGYIKKFKENGYDFFTSRGYFTFDLIPEVNLRAGYDKIKIGEGYRSMVLSDHSNNYLFAQLNTQVWRLQYTNIWGKLAAYPSTAYLGSEQFSKGFSFHRLGLNIGKKANIGVFETVIFGGLDSATMRSIPMPLEFYNPIIFLRGAELESGSYYGKVQLGFDWKWIITRGLEWYGQFVLDEFKLDEILAANGWWANKFALQAGLKYFNVAGVDNLDLQVEGNMARPYTYSHRDAWSSMTHYGQSLAHPLGSNFYEVLGIVRAQPFPRLSLTAKGQYVIYGQDYEKEDGELTNWGSDPMKSYFVRERDYGNSIGQGNTTHQLMLDFQASYQLRHNLFIDGRAYMRKVDAEMDTPFTDMGALLSVRMNIAKRADFY